MAAAAAPISLFIDLPPLLWGVAYADVIKVRFRIRIRAVKLRRLVNEALLRRSGAAPGARENAPDLDPPPNMKAVLTTF